MPLPPIPPEIAPYVTLTPEGANFRNPARDFVVQGLLVAVLLPVAWYLLSILIFLSEPDALWPALAGATALSLFSLLLAVLVPGIGFLRSRSRVSRVEPSGALQVGTRRLAPGEVVSVRVGAPSALLKWKGLAVATSTGETVWVLVRLPPSRRLQLQGLATWLGEAAGAAGQSVQVDVKDASNPLNLSGNTTLAACYFPIQGIWLIASLLVLLFSKDPRARFSAKQSLAFYLISGGVVMVWITVLAFPTILLADTTGKRELVAILAIPVMIVPALVRIVLGVVATWRASQGRLWVIPGLGWLSRKWLPPEA